MGDIRLHSPVLPIMAAFSRYPAALDWARERAQQEWGPLALRSSTFEFQETDFYTATMGASIQKELWAFETLILPDRLAPMKHQTNAWEAEYGTRHPAPEPRPLNLDPGYLTEAKLVLATTKDRDHRIYLTEGIYAEVTLHYQSRAWQSRPWTYPDYQRADYHAFLTQCREYLRQRFRQSAPRRQSDHE